MLLAAAAAVEHAIEESRPGTAANVQVNTPGRRTLSGVLTYSAVLSPVRERGRNVRQAIFTAHDEAVGADRITPSQTRKTTSKNNMKNNNSSNILHDG